jgi:hypothetical protein
MEPLIYNNHGDISIIRTEEEYVRAVLHDSEQIEARCEIFPWDNQGERYYCEHWTIWHKDRYSWHCVSSPIGLCEEEVYAWDRVAHTFDCKGYTGSDNARFEDADSIKAFIAEIENDEEYAEELKFQQAMLAMLEPQTVFSTSQNFEV